MQANSFCRSNIRVGFPIGLLVVWFARVGTPRAVVGPESARRRVIGGGDDGTRRMIMAVETAHWTILWVAFVVESRERSGATVQEDTTGLFVTIPPVVSGESDGSRSTPVAERSNMQAAFPVTPLLLDGACPLLAHRLTSGEGTECPRAC